MIIIIIIIFIITIVIIIISSDIAITTGAEGWVSYYVRVNVCVGCSLKENVKGLRHTLRDIVLK